MEEDAVLDFSELDVTKHGGVLLDGVANPMTLKRQREVLQGRSKTTKGGRSATMRFSYPFTLCRQAVVATFDLSAVGLEAFKNDHWLSDDRNVIQLWLDAPAWHATADGARPSPERAATPRAQMTKWGVTETAAFLERCDLHGPAQVCRQNGVAGADLLQFSVTALAQDLRLTPFAARKIVSARDTFLA